MTTTSPSILSLRRRSVSGVVPASPTRGSTSSKQSNSIGSLWTVEMTRLRQAGSFFEAVECLRTLRTILEGVDRSDRMKFCKADFEATTRALQRRRGAVWSDALFREVMVITLAFFDTSAFQVLPLAVVQDIFLWLPVSSCGHLAAVSKEWRFAAYSDEIWTLLYIKRFLTNNPGQLPRPTASLSLQAAFRARLLDPAVGDHIEVAWRGKFRLETQDVYQGLAWWVAEVVEKSGDGKYKIRYPGWESRWDEWVPRARLRWTVERNTLVSIEAGDVVELWCCGANVPGAWLESKVKKVRGSRYCLGRVLASGYLWVERGRLRLVRKGAEGAAADGRPVRRGSLAAMRQCLRRAVSSASGATCIVM